MVYYHCTQKPESYLSLFDIIRAVYLKNSDGAFPEADASVSVVGVLQRRSLQAEV
jgi:hypothetical protein